MPLDVTTWWEGQAALKTPTNYVKKFTIGTSDYSAFVTRWPSVSTKWNEVKGRSIPIKCANQTQAFNFFETDRTKFQNVAKVEVGFTHPTSGDELITVISGKVDRVRFDDGICNINITDKFKVLGERVIGDTDNPKVYSDYPSNVVWNILTDPCSLDATQTSANTDINYDYFTSWHNIFTDNSIYVETSIEGKKAGEIIKKIAEITRSSIYIENDKIHFQRNSLITSDSITLTNSEIISSRFEIDDEKTINKQYVFADYNVNSDSFETTVSHTNSTSVDSFGLREDRIKEQAVWFQGSLSALDIAQRIVFVKSKPVLSGSVKTTMIGATASVGDTLIINDDLLGLSNSYKAVTTKIDTDTGEVELSIDESAFFSAFVLDASSLDGEDVLG